MSIDITNMPDDRNDRHPADRGHAATAARVEAMLEALAACTVTLAASALWHEAIGDILARLGRASEVSRVTLFEIHPGPDGSPVESCRFDWAEPGLAPISGDPHYANIPITDPATGALDDWSSRRAAGEIVAALRRETTDDIRRIFEEHGTLSFLSVPLHVEGTWWGFLGFDDCRSERPWSALEIGLLRAAATVMAGAIQRERMEQRLRQSEERYSLAARGANDGLFDFDLAAGTAFCTERVREILCANLDVGCGPAALADFFVPEDARVFATRLAGVFRDHIEQFDFEGRLRAGERDMQHWIVLRGLVLYGDDGAAQRVVGSLRDITARKIAESDLAHARGQLAEAVEAIQDGFVVFDAEDRIALYNTHYLESFSAKPESVRVGMTIRELLELEASVRFPAPDQRDEYEAWVAEKVAEHKALMRDFVHRRHNGRWARLNEYRTADGGIVGILTDVTDLKNRSIELKRSRQLLKAVIDAVPALISVKDAESRYLMMNRFQAELYGTTTGDAVGRTASEIMGADYGEQARALDRRVLETGEQVSLMEQDFVDASGGVHDWYTIKLPLHGEANVPEGIVTVALDVTQLIRLERARANLARYVPPSMATILAEADEPMGPPREQVIAVLFVDIVGFTALASEEAPAEIFALLRGFQSRMADAVFAHGGTLDKFTGDGVMATFGTPDTGPRDAGNALACARAIERTMAVWNAERAASGAAPVRVVMGLHFGSALLGTVGDERRLEFAVIGDTVNVAARLESLARELDAGMVMSGALYEAVEREIASGAGDLGSLFDGLERRPAQALRGRRQPVDLWVLPR
ncbi:MAG: adenylate/guanylate cyclase domain-containing protein [Dongiaceae bacterium]